MHAQSRKVLIVDDEAKIIEVVKAFLESKGFQVFSAGNGKQALELFEREAVGIVLLDLMLPDISGEEICSRIRKKSRVPIIMLTAKVDEAHQLAGLSIGADDYITKPFSLTLLNARIEAVLRRSAEEQAPLYQRISFGQGDLEIDLEGHAVYKQHQQVNLTPNEFNILIALIKHPNKVFTRDELISSALGDDFEGLDRTIDGYVKNIRQKIELNAKAPEYILTIHGVGYKFGGS